MLFVLTIIVLIIALIVGLIGIPVRGAAKKNKDPDALAAAPYFSMGLVGLLILAVLLGFLSSIAIVGTKEVGIVTAFNKPTGTLDNGFHLIAPWESVSEMDAAIQTDTHTQSDNNACIPTRIAHQIVACVDATVRWRIREGAADTLFRDYRDFGNVRNSLVTRELSTDTNAVFHDYDPLAVDASGNTTAASLNSLANAVLSQMQGQIGGQVEVLSVFIPVMHFDGATQGRLNALQAQIAQTRIAEQAIKTAQAQAAANQALATSVNLTPNVLVSRCFDLVGELINKGQQLPAGFSCWPGGSTGVVIPATK